MDAGRVECNPTEMLFWMYCPISVPGNIHYTLPDNLAHFAPIVNQTRAYLTERFRHNFAYLTAKTLWVEGNYIGNRPGWHIDGYRTDDVNFIWSDRAPTEFVLGSFQLSNDCDTSLAEMAIIGDEAEEAGTIRTWPDKHLLMLDPMVIHRSPVAFEPGMRTFVKVSLSPDRYDLKGNSINHKLPSTSWPLVDRQPTRNHPASKEL